MSFAEIHIYKKNYNTKNNFLTKNLIKLKSFSMKKNIQAKIQNTLN